MKFLVALIFALTLVALPATIFAQNTGTKEKKYDSVITSVYEENRKSFDNKPTLYQKIRVQVTNGDLDGKSLDIENGSIPTSNLQRYKVGDKVIVTINTDPSGRQLIFISDYIRRTPLYILFGLFIFLTIAVSRKKGILSLLGMAVSFFVIFNFILPQILLGNNPVLIAIFASLFFIPISFFLAHGLNKKTIAAIVGTVIALTFTGILATIFVNIANLTGYNEEVGYLQLLNNITIDVRGLLLAGIIISLSGILDDITISQAAIVFELKLAAPKLRLKELYFKAMEVGKDHIASVVNTLVLAYTGSSLALLLLFTDSTRSFTEVINYEFIAEEIIRTLVSSIGLIMAVPITTFIACLLADKYKTHYTETNS